MYCTLQNMEVTMKYTILIKLAKTKHAFASKTFKNLDHPPAVGSTVYPEHNREFQCLIEATVVKHSYPLKQNEVWILCELESADEAKYFTEEYGWSLIKK